MVGPLPISALAAAEALSAVPARLGLDAPRLDGVLEPLDSEQRWLLRQGLEDLGYLAEGAASGVAAFRRALDAWHDDLGLAHPLGGAAERMRQLLSLDGDFDLLRMPAPGERSLASRIVHYRLRVYGLAAFPADTLFSPDSVAAVDAAREFVGKSADNDLAVINRLGSAESATSAFMAKFGTTVFVYHDPELDMPRQRRELARLFMAVGRHRHTDRARTRRRKGIKEDFHYRGSMIFSRKLRDEIGRRAQAPEFIGTSLNQFGIRLLQVRLWMLGLYKGELDAEWGRMSNQALDDFLAQSKVQAINFRFRLHDGYCGLNLRELLKRYIPQAMKAGQGTDVAALGDALFEQTTRLEQWRRLQEVYVRMTDEEAELYTGSSKRRRYFGLRSMIAGVGRVVGDALSNLRLAVRRLRSALQKLVGAALNVFRTALVSVRAALAVAGLALRHFRHWVGKQPLVTVAASGHVVMTRSDWDHDTLHYATHGVSAALLDLHRRRMTRLHAAFKSAMLVAAKVLHIAAAAASQNWLAVSWRITRLLRDDAAAAELRVVLAEW
jgi:hypothetical protein